MRPYPIAAALVLSSLSACVGQTGLSVRQHPPTLVADSAKPTNVIGSCMVDASDKLGQVSYVPTDKGAKLTVQLGSSAGGHTITVAADIEDQGDHRHVSLWLFKTVWSGVNRKRLDTFKACL